MELKVDVDISRWDLLRVNLALYPRLRSTYVTILVFAAVGLAIVLPDKGVPTSVQTWMVTLIAALFCGALGFVIALAISLAFMLFAAREKNGILGRHTYELEPEGLRERTDTNETLSKWSGVHSIRTLGAYLIIRISSYLYHVIPTRHFPDAASKDAFIAQARKYYESAT